LCSTFSVYFHILATRIEIPLFVFFSGLVAPRAKPDDGYIDLVLVRKPCRRYQGLGILLTGHSGKFTKWKFVEYYKVRQFVLEPDVLKCKHINKEVMLDVDGERMDVEKPVLVKCLHGKCRWLY